jgi:hypothetical protein
MATSTLNGSPVSVPNPSPQSTPNTSNPLAGSSSFGHPYVPSGSGIVGGTPSYNPGADVPVVTQSTPANQPQVQSQLSASPNQFTGTYSSYKPPTFSDIPNYLKASIGSQSPFEIVKGVGGIAFGATKSALGIQDNSQQNFNQQVSNALSRSTISQNELINARGTQTAQTFQISQMPTDALLRSASLGDKPSLEAARIRAEDSISKQSQSIAQNLLYQDQQKLSEFIVNNPNASQDQIKNYAAQLDNNRIQAVQNQINPIVQNYQAQLDSAARNGRIVRLAIDTVGAVAIGIATVGLGLGAGLLGKGAGVITGASVGISSGNLANTLGSSNVPLSEKALQVGEFAVPLAGFAIGSKLYSKFGPQSLDPQFQMALNNPRIEIVSKGEPQVLTTVEQIKALNLLENQKAELIGRLNFGERIGIQKFDIKAGNAKEQEIIDRNLPNRQIINVGKIATLDNGRLGIIEGNSYLKTSFSKGEKTYTDLTSSMHLGVYNAETGKAAVASLSIKVPESSKPVNIAEISKRLEIIKAESPQYLQFDTGKINLNTGEIFRRIQTRSSVYEGETRIATKSEPLTYKDLAEVANSELKKYPSLENENVEIQQLKFIRGADMQIKKAVDNIGKGSVGISSRELTFETIMGRSRTGKLSEPVAFTREARTKVMKPFSPFKKLENPVGIPKEQLQILRQSERAVNFDMASLNLKGTIKSQIRGSAKEASKILNIKQNSALISLGASQQNKKIVIPSYQNVFNLGTGKISKNILSNIPEVSYAGISNTKQASALLQIPTQSQQQLQKQIQKIEQLANPTAPPTFPSFPISKIDIPGFPILQGGFGNRTLKKLKRQSKKSSSDYAASLAAAAFQEKPIKVSRKQFQALKTGIYSGFETRPLLEITPDKKMQKQLEKVNF